MRESPPMCMCIDMLLGDTKYNILREMCNMHDIHVCDKSSVGDLYQKLTCDVRSRLYLQNLIRLWWSTEYKVYPDTKSAIDHWEMHYLYKQK